MIDIITKIYIGANLFFAGYYLADNYKWRTTITEKLICILWCLGTMFFGSFYVALCFLWVVISEGFKNIDGIFQISFWFTYFLTNKWNNLQKHQLQMINRIAVNQKNKKTLQDTIYRYCTALINKRNNYVYIEPTEPPF